MPPLTPANAPEVVKANALVEAAYRLSLAEQRIILACIAQVRRDAPLTDDMLYSVSVQDMARLSGSQSKSLYKELAEATEHLFERRVSIHDRPNGAGRRTKVMVTRWVQTAFYIKEEGRVELRFSKDMIPYLSQLTEQFTRYALSDVARMNSPHAIRIYELLMQFQNVGAREMPLPWLKQRLGLTTEYPVFADFRRWVIEVAVKQINAKTSMKVSWTPVKTGRKITALRFEFKFQSKPKRLPEPKPESTFLRISKADIERAAKPGESYLDVARRLKG